MDQEPYRAESEQEKGTLARGLRLLSVLAAVGKPTGLSELTQITGFSKPTVHRLARALVHYPYQPFLYRTIIRSSNNRVKPLDNISKTREAWTSSTSHEPQLSEYRTRRLFTLPGFPPKLIPLLFHDETHFELIANGYTRLQDGDVWRRHAC